MNYHRIMKSHNSIHLMILFLVAVHYYYVLSNIVLVDGFVVGVVPMTKKTTTSCCTSLSSSSFYFRSNHSSFLQLEMTKLVYNGKEKEFKAGTPLSKAVAQLGCKVTYSCRK